MEIKDFQVEKTQAGMRFDRMLALLLPEFSRTHCKELIQSKKVTVNGIFLAPSHHLHEGDHIRVAIGSRIETLPVYERTIPLIYEDDDILVLNKPAGLSVHPVRISQSDTLVNILLYMEKKLSSVSPLRPGIVHRLDKDTSGVMLIAKNNAAHFELVRQFKERVIEKEYRAIVSGTFSKKEGIIDMPLKVQPHLRKTKISFVDSKEAITRYQVLAMQDQRTILALYPKTGRMHQLRVHLSFLGHPIVGDLLYGGEKSDRLYLHARRIKLFHPKTKKELEFQIEADF